MAAGVEAPGFCRDCLAAAPLAGRCAACGSPRMIRHPELFDLHIAHLDCDAFYAAVEKRDDPSLTTKPLIIGGGKRGVVSTACYVARTYGVRSAMPMFKALKLCPQAVVKPPDIRKYAAVSQEIRALMQTVTPAVEPLSIDEAFLDLGGTERLHKAPPAITLARLARRIRKDLDIPVSIGLSYNKYLAKVASDLDKPRGFAVIGKAEALGFLAKQPVHILWGVGEAFRQKLARDGITQVGQIQAMPEAELFRRYGQLGAHIHRLAAGLDARPVKTDRAAKSVSAERTFEADIDDIETLETVLWRVSEEVSRRLKASGIAGRTVTLKLKTADFKLRTRAYSPEQPVQHAFALYEAGRRLLEREMDGNYFRLLGIGVSGLVPHEADAAADLFQDPQVVKQAAAEGALDTLRRKYRRDIIGKGRGLGRQVSGIPKKTPPETQ